MIAKYKYGGSTVNALRASNRNQPKKSYPYHILGDHVRILNSFARRGVPVEVSFSCKTTEECIVNLLLRP